MNSVVENLTLELCDRVIKSRTDIKYLSIKNIYVAYCPYCFENKRVEKIGVDSDIEGISHKDTCVFTIAKKIKTLI